jgi:hypothetical protein
MFVRLCTVQPNQSCKFADSGLKMLARDHVVESFAAQRADIEQIGGKRNGEARGELDIRARHAGRAGD